MDIRRVISDRKIEIIDIRYGSLDGMRTFKDKKRNNEKGFRQLPYSLLESVDVRFIDKEFLTNDGIFFEWILDKRVEEKMKEFWEIENTPSLVELFRYFYI